MREREEEREGKREREREKRRERERERKRKKERERERERERLAWRELAGDPKVEGTCGGTDRHDVEAPCEHSQVSMTHSYVCDMTHSYVCHDTLKCLRRLIHMRDMTH